MLHNLCSVTEVSPHEQCALLHTPGHVVLSILLQGVAGAGPGAGGGAELLAAVVSIIIIRAATQQEGVLGVAGPPNHEFGQLARGGGGGEEHLRGVGSTMNIKSPSY